ncbi:MAG TPA: hypothetical protein DCR97_05465 [Deltaproteobacteria bacterium]|nr:hypothetical protein [Deltaproteobacteria bacterium]
MRHDPISDLPAFWKRTLFVVLTAITCATMTGLIPLTGASAVLQEELTKEAIIRLTNQARSRNGLEKLAENEVLGRVAEYRARDMLAKQYFGHVSPSGQEASDIAERRGYRYKTIAENIVRGSFRTNQGVVDCWMRSPAHRKNILSTDIREIGVAIVRGTMWGEDTWIGVQLFGLQARPRKSSTVRSSQQEETRRAVSGVEEQDNVAQWLGRGVE